jgi:hypothetical protein
MAMFRALVMMVFLIAIPLAALFGSSLPDAIKALKEGRWPSLASLTQGTSPAKTAAGLEEPPKFEPGAGAASRSASPIPAPATTATEPAPPATALDPPPASSRPAEGNPPPAAGVVPAHYETAADPGPSPARLSPAAALSPPPPSAAQNDPFTLIENRLRQLGATYFLLESRGDQQQQYRFYCKMALGGNPNYTRCFEAVDAEPLRAMSQVLQQVESWTSAPK